MNDSLPTLKSKFDIKTLWIFGSYLRGGQGKTSDIDILVEYRKNPDLFEFMALEYYLSDLLKTKVDLVMKTALKERLRDKILREVTRV